MANPLIYILIFFTQFQSAEISRDSTLFARACSPSLPVNLSDPDLGPYVGPVFGPSVRNRWPSLVNWLSTETGSSTVYTSQWPPSSLFEPRSSCRNSPLGLRDPSNGMWLNPTLSIQQGFAFVWIPHSKLPEPLFDPRSIAELHPGSQDFAHRNAAELSVLNYKDSPLYGFRPQSSQSLCPNRIHTAELYSGFQNFVHWNSAEFSVLNFDKASPLSGFLPQSFQSLCSSRIQTAKILSGPQYFVHRNVADPTFWIHSRFGIPWTVSRLLVSTW